MLAVCDPSTESFGFLAPVPWAPAAVSVAAGVGVVATAAAAAAASAAAFSCYSLNSQARPTIISKAFVTVFPSHFFALVDSTSLHLAFAAFSFRSVILMRFAFGC